MLINIMDISRIMVHKQHIGEDKLKENSIEVKKYKTIDGNFSQARSDGHGNPRF